jgi:hypothetical protein
VTTHPVHEHPAAPVVPAGAGTPDQTGTSHHPRIPNPAPGPLATVPVKTDAEPEPKGADHA